MVLRTPTKVLHSEDSNQEPGAMANPSKSMNMPSGKLAAITKKKNEMVRIMNNHAPDLKMMKILYDEYKEKVYTFRSTCEEYLNDKELLDSQPDYYKKLKDWYIEHYKQDIKVFLQKYSEWSQANVLEAGASASNYARSAKSVSSKRSSASAMRLKLMEDKARRIAEEEAIKQKMAMDETLRKSRIEEEEQRKQQEAEEIKLKQKKRAQLSLEQERLTQYQNQLKVIELNKQAKYEEVLERSLNEYEETETNVTGARSKAKSRVNFARSLEDKVKSDISRPNPYFDDTPLELRSKVIAPGFFEEKLSRVEPTNAKSSRDPVLEVLARQNETMLMIAKTHVKAALPKNEPTNFDGSDPTQYLSFRQDFESMISEYVDSDSDKLHYLERYTSGLPLQLVKSCRSRDRKDGYHRAWKILDQEYGNENSIANSYLQKLNNWKVIKNEDGESLRELSIFLMSCNNMMVDISTLNHLNSPNKIYKIVMKLPFRMREKWRSNIHGIRQKNGLENFRDLAKFVQSQSSLLNMPLYGNISEPRSERTRTYSYRSSQEHKKKVFSTSTRSPGKESECILCGKQNHSLARCFVFKRKPYEERLEYVKVKRLCFACLGLSHSSKDCTKRAKCDICKKSHPTVLHKNKDDSDWTQKKNEEATPCESKEENKTLPEEKVSGQTALVTGCVKAMERKVHPSIPVRVKIQGSNVIATTYMGINPYCSDVYMNEDLLEEFGLKGVDTNITMTTMHHKKLSTKTKVINNLQIFDLDENNFSLIPVVYVKKPWPFENEDSPLPSDVEKYPYLRNLPFQFVDKKIGILVGLNHSEITKPLEVISGPNPEDPYATLHKFGWAFNGVVNNTEDMNKRCFYIKTVEHIEINKTFQDYCAKDFSDDNSGCGPSIEDLKWQNKIDNSIARLPNGQFEVGLPFKEENVDFPDNYEPSLKLLMSSKRRLKSNKEYYSEYSKFMDLMLDSEFVERVPLSELQIPKGKAWYLFHFGIFHKQKKKIRIVFDASRKYRNVCLNDMLYKGPDLANGLLGILMRFREGRVAITADIQKMFYCVKVRKEDRDFLRFLWFPDGNLNLDPVIYRVSVHIFGAISSPSIANYCLQKSALIPESKKFSEEVRHTVRNNFYVDDWLKSTDSELVGLQMAKQLTEMLNISGFKLTGFVSNSRQILSEIDPADLGKDVRNIDLSCDELPLERALGVFWNVEEDYFGFKINLPKKPNTKRGVLGTIFSVYDPIGMVIPALLPGKKIFQQCCHYKLDWDDSLPIHLHESWVAWLEDIGKISQYRVPRSVVPSFESDEIQLHLFCDGSEKAYGCVSYLRFVSSSKEVYCSFIMAKSRLVPVKGSAVATIPRIELNAAKLSVLMLETLKRELTINFKKVWLWTDSTTVIKYINNETRRFHRFVSNRISYIREHTLVEDWRYVPTDLNPADLASRGVKPDVILKENLWRNGPRFLWKKEAEWPIASISKVLPNEDPEVQKEKKLFTTKTVEKEPFDKLLESTSSWFKVIVRVAWMLKFKDMLKKKKCYGKKITPGLLAEAEKVILMYIQEKSYSEVIKRLKLKKPILKKENILKLNPFIDQEGLLRVGGRLGRASVDFDVKHPIILPGRNFNIELLVRDKHTKLGHMGKEMVLAELRTKSWIVGVNTLIKKIVRNCIACRKRQGRPSEQIMSDLPVERFCTDKPVFSHIGIDVFGPFFVTRGRTQVKQYGLVLTCLTTRAAHLEVLYSIDSSSFICALRRFIARRGRPMSIRSDNGTNFVAAEKELRLCIDSWNESHVEEWMLQNHIQWNFQPPYASHFGGIWEREIRTIRKILSGLTNEQPIKFTDEELNTLFCEIESILNSRPLTPVSDNPQDLEAITPNHLLLSRSGIGFPPGLFEKTDCYPKRKWRQIQYLADIFWVRWRREYVIQLQKRQKWTIERRSHMVGDLVMLTDQSLPRNHWSIGRVVRIHEDEQQNVRVADIQISKIKGEVKNRPKIIRRPVDKLILIMPFEENN